jgi:hypothetical protein
MLQEAQKFDPSGVTTCMLIRAFIEEVTKQTSFTVHDMFNKDCAVQKELNTIKTIIKHLEQPVIKNEVNKKSRWLASAVKHYDINDSKGLQKLLGNEFTQAHIRHNALLAIEKLKAYQFARGDYETTEIKYNKHICQFWNMNSLTRIIAVQPVSGVTIALVRTPKAFFSYFVFAIRNGGNIIVLTDKVEHSQPEYEDMTRRPDRDFEKRANLYYFPYHLLEVSTELCGRLHIPKQEGLVLYNQSAIKLGKISQLQPEEAVWKAMMLELIRQRYWIQKRQLPEMSFTGEMVKKPRALADATSHLPATIELLEFPWLTTQDLTTQHLIKDGQWETTPQCHNEWMEARYGDKVNEEFLNLVDNGSLPALPAPKGTPKTTHYQKNPAPLKGLSPTTFGTKNQLLKNYKYHARQNKAAMIQKLAEEEYSKKKGKIWQWFKKRVEKNKDNLLAAIGHGKLRATGQVGCAGAERMLSRRSFDIAHEISANILQVHYVPQSYVPMNYLSPSRSTVVLGDLVERYRRNNYRKCCLMDAKATIFATFRIMTPTAIAAVCGCEIHELPFFLRFYYERDPYTGNSILNMLDPLDNVENPWKRLKLEVVVCLSRRAYNRLRKDQGMPHFKDWNSIRWR